MKAFFLRFWLGMQSRCSYAVRAGVVATFWSGSLPVSSKAGVVSERSDLLNANESTWAFATMDRVGDE